MKKKYKILAVVSARGGSKGVPNKNIKKINNIPLIAHCLKTLVKIRDIDKIIVSSDSKKILKVASNVSKKIITSVRPKYLARDKTPLTSVVKYVALEQEKINYIPDFVLQIAPTCPFIKKNLRKNFKIT